MRYPTPQQRMLQKLQSQQPQRWLFGPQHPHPQRPRQTQLQAQVRHSAAAPAQLPHPQHPLPQQPLPQQPLPQQKHSLPQKKRQHPRADPTSLPPVAPAAYPQLPRLHRPLPQRPQQAQQGQRPQQPQEVQPQPQTRPPQQPPKQTQPQQPPAKAPKKKQQQRPKQPPDDRRPSRRDEGRWLKRFEELRAYKDAHGDCNVPQKYEPNPVLARWVSQQRVEYKKFLSLRSASPDRSAESTGITRERVGALDAIGFEWDALDAAWSRKLDELRAYRTRHGDCDVPLRYSENPSLGRWVIRQRHEMRHLREGRPSQMTEFRRRALDGMGFVWDTHDRLWNARWEELRRYRDEHGHCNVPYVFTPNRQLGHWVRNQRTQYLLRRAGRNNRLTDERLTKLEELGFLWSAGTASAADGVGGGGGGGGREKGQSEESGGDGGEEEEEEEALGEKLCVDDDVKKPVASGLKR